MRHCHGNIIDYSVRKVVRKLCYVVWMYPASLNCSIIVQHPDWSRPIYQQRRSITIFDIAIPLGEILLIIVVPSRAQHLQTETHWNLGTYD